MVLPYSISEQTDINIKYKYLCYMENELKFLVILPYVTLYYFILVKWL